MTQAELDLFCKFANHRDGCHCFICRNLTGPEYLLLDKLWLIHGGRK